MFFPRCTSRRSPVPSHLASPNSHRRRPASWTAAGSEPGPGIDSPCPRTLTLLGRVRYTTAVAAFSPGNRLIAAIDTPNRAEADALVTRLGGVADWIKLGLELFCSEGPAIVEHH